MARGEGFAIYAAAGGYVAVTSPVRQRILAALEERDRTLTELVALTGKAKSTLSAVHLRELRRGGLVLEQAHARDSRVKVYRLAARRIGSSSVPLADLRDAVRTYVSSPQGGLALPLASIVQAFEQLPRLKPDEQRWVGLAGERMGSLAAAHLTSQAPEAALRELAAVWRDNALGKQAKPRPKASGLDVTHAAGAHPGGARCAFLRGFLQGALTTRCARPAWVHEASCGGEAKGGSSRCSFTVAWGAA